MPPKKRRGRDDDALEAPGPVKRKRVSLACDSCRSAREKCDGTHPQCGTCAAQRRDCSYTPASKKRGIPTGYLRAIETSLAWVFENVPDSEAGLQRFLSQNGGMDGVRVFANHDSTGKRLHQKWSKCRVRKQIARVLSDDASLPADSSTEGPDSGDEEGQEASSTESARAKEGLVARVSLPFTERLDSHAPVSNAHLSRDTASSLLKLPSNWCRLLEIYNRYTHCWLPLLDCDTLAAAAAAYPQEGISLPSGQYHQLGSVHTELWAALAVAAFQDAASSSPSTDPAMAPSKIFLTARRFVRPTEDDYGNSDICATILHALIMSGQGKRLSAWLLIGQASRLTTYVRAKGQWQPNDRNPPISARDIDNIYGACFILETVLSLAIGQIPTLSPDTTILGTMPVLTMDWSHVVGIGPGDNRQQSFGKVQPLLSFQQLFEFSIALSHSVDARSRGRDSASVTESLVKCVRPEFAFCNTLILGASTPTIPSAYVLKAVFLAATVELVPDHRPSLLSNFLEVVETCVSHFGSCGTPPLVAALMSAVYERHQVHKISGVDRQRWTSTMDRLGRVWEDPRIKENKGGSHNAALAFNDSANMFHAQTFTHGLTSNDYPGTEENATSGNPMPYQLSPTGHSIGILSQSHEHSIPHVARGSSLQANMPSLPLLTEPVNSAWLANGISSSAIDYDAISEELRGMDYTDGMEMDPQFMANLGFAPGSDLADIFQGALGS